MYLVEHGANPNDVYIDEKNKTHNLLMDAIIVNNTEFALLLLDKGATTAFKDKEEVTVLTQAAYQGQSDVVKKLLSMNVDDTVPNKEGINPLIAACSEGHVEVVKMLLEYNSKTLNSEDKDGTNALMAASVRGHKDVVSLLLETGAEVNAQNVDGHTALMFAYNGKNQVETLLDKYSEYMKDNTNSTKIIEEALQTHVDVVSILLEKGANVELKDKEGHTAKDFDYKPPTLVAATDGPLEDTITQDEL
jgi:ankyrin repeat protein